MTRLASVLVGAMTAAWLGCGLNSSGRLTFDAWPDASPEETSGDTAVEHADGPAEETAVTDDGGPEAPADVADDATTDAPAPFCGDGIVQAPEECDEGGSNSDTEPNACRTDCRMFHCGDRVLDRGEACDDGNTTDDDGCTNRCSLPGCGDEVVQPTEECDDGNLDDSDACLSSCRNASCGDGFVWIGSESCDGDSPRNCTTGCGSLGTQACNAAACDWAPCAPPPEACNGVDDDCDLEVDEGFACRPGAPVGCTTRCGSAGTGTCTAACAPPAPADCPPPPEACNGADDDCDGTTDEGCGTVIPNDACADAIDISAGGDFSGTTAGAADDNAACAIGPSGCGAGGGDVFYRFTLAQPEAVFLSLQLGTTWDTVLHVRAGSCTGTAAACSDDACGTNRSQWVGLLEAGTYNVVVDGCFADSSGDFTLRYSHSPCPELDADPRLLLTTAARVSGSTCDWWDDTEGTCGGGDGRDIPFAFGLCPGDTTVHMSTCGDGASWRSTVYVRTGSGGVCGGRQAGCAGPSSDSSCRQRSSLDATVSGPDLAFAILDGGTTCGGFIVDIGWW